MAGENLFLRKVLRDDEVIGYLKGVSVLSVFQALQTDEKSCTILLHHLKTDERGGAVFQKGKIIHAWTEKFLGEEAAIEIIPWDPVDATLYALKHPPPMTIQRTLDDLTLEAFAHNDEAFHLNDPKEIFQSIHFGEQENPEHATQQGGFIMAKDTMSSVLDRLSQLSGYEGAAIISEEGLIMASHFVKNQPEDVVAALVQETVNMAQKVIDQAKWGKLDNLVIESEDDHKLILYRTKFGYVALFGNKTLNLGLARVSVDEAAEDLEKA